MGNGAWRVGEDRDGKFLYQAGKHKYLRWTESIGTSDFKMTVDLKFQKLGGTAAAINFSQGNNFGFDASRTNVLFVEGRMFGGKYQRVGPRGETRANYNVVNGQMVKVQVERENGNFTVMINDKLAYTTSNINNSLPWIQLRPWRSQMKLYKWTICLPTNQE